MASTRVMTARIAELEAEVTLLKETGISLEDVLKGEEEIRQGKGIPLEDLEREIDHIAELKAANASLESDVAGLRGQIDMNVDYSKQVARSEETLRAAMNRIKDLEDEIDRLTEGEVVAEDEVMKITQPSE